MAVTAEEFDLSDFAFPAPSVGGYFGLSGPYFFGVTEEEVDYEPTDDPLMHSPAEILRKLLLDRGLGTDGASRSAWPVFTRNEPPAPDDCITLYDTQGTSDGRAHVDGTQFQHYGFQLRVRSGQDRDGWQKSSLVRDLFNRQVHNAVVVMADDTRYVVYAVTRVGQVVPIGKEESSKRNLFTLNGTVSVRKLQPV